MDTTITLERLIQELARLKPESKERYDSLTLSDSLDLRNDLGFDSLDTLEACYELDRTFKVETPIDAETPHTLGALKNFYQNLVDEQA